MLETVRVCCQDAGFKCIFLSHYIDFNCVVVLSFVLSVHVCWVLLVMLIEYGYIL